MAVVVTYQPELAETVPLLESLARQVDATVVVDNGSEPSTLDALRGETDRLGLHLLGLGVNRGIGAAQNVGIARARALGASLVLLSDQDSLPADDMVARLRAALTSARAFGDQLAGVGPVTVDQRVPGAALAFSDHRWGPRRAEMPTRAGELVDVTFLIASGSLLDVGAIDEIGPMNETWFIDHVDLEWGLRARLAGYRLAVVVGAELRHSLGDTTRHVPGRRNRTVHIHSAPRNYYMVRNTILLIRSGLMRPAWRWGYAAWITKYAAYYALVVPVRRARIGRMAHGIWDALRGRTGPMPPVRRRGVPAVQPSTTSRTARR